MYKKIIAGIIFILSLNLAFAETCTIGDAENGCKLLTENFNTFKITTDSQDEIKNINLRIYDKQNPTNFITTKKSTDSEFEFLNVEPFTIPGTYIAEAIVTTKSAKNIPFKTEFEFDDSNPKKPFISIPEVSTSPIPIKAETEFAQEKVYVDEVQLNSNQLELADGIHILNFKTIDTISNKESEILKKVVAITSNGWETNKVSGVQIDSTLPAYTIEQNFLVKGTTTGTGYVFVNGIKTPVVNGEFARFILLNEGENEIKVEGQNTDTKTVNFANFRFKFESLDVDEKVRVFNTDEVSISGTANYDIPFEVYVNGKYSQRVTPSSQSFSFNINLEEGKNYLYLKGYNGEEIMRILYLDETMPEVEVLSEKVSKNSEFAFRVHDEFGVDLDTISLTLNGENYIFGDFEKSGDYYKISLEEFADDDLSYSLFAKDLAGNENSKSGTLTFGDEQTFIEKIEGQGNFKQFGKELFLDANRNIVTIYPTKRIAFESVLLDDKDITSYSIAGNGIVSMAMDTKNPKGNLTFTFIDSNQQKYVEKYEYVSGFEKPIVQVDYISNPAVKSGGKFFISGKVEDSNFNWDSFRINGDTAFVYGDYFESFAKASDSGNVVFTGNDFEGASLISPNLNTQEINNVEVLNEPKSNYLEVSGLISGASKVKVSRVDGVLYENEYFGEEFRIATGDRQGIRTLGFEGYDLSGKVVKNYDPVKVDTLLPEIYFYEMEGDGNVKVVVDGTLSEVSSVNFSKGGEDITYNSGCDYVKVGKYDECHFVGNLANGDILDIEVMDASGNRASRSFTVGTTPYNAEPDYSTNVPEIFFSGMDKNVLPGKYFVAGQVKSESPLTSVKIGSQSCEFDDFNFVCGVNVVEGENTFKVDAMVYNGVDVSNSTTINGVAPLRKPTLTLVAGNGIYESDEGYYLTKTDFDVNASLLDSGIVSVLIDDSEKLVGEKEAGNHRIPIDAENELTQELQLVDISLKQEDEYGQSVESDKISGVYNKVLSALLWIILQ